MEQPGTKLRLFLAIAIPERAKAAAAEFMRVHPGLPARWTAPENLHITVLFLGWIDAESILEINQLVCSRAAVFQNKPLGFTHLDWAPPGSASRMIWLYGESDESWNKLKEQLRNTLASRGIYRDRDERPFTAHVTIARFEPTARHKLPDIRTPFEETFTPSELLLMESKLSPHGPTYTIRERFAFMPGIGDKPH